MDRILAVSAAGVKAGRCLIFSCGFEKRASQLLALPPETQLVSAVANALCSSKERGGKGRHRLNKIRRLVAVLALLALLATGVSGIAETLAAAEVPACCNTAYCPLHHSQSRNTQKDRGDCGSTSLPGQTDSSVRACDSTPPAAVVAVEYILCAPVVLGEPSVSRTAAVAVSLFLPFVSTLPSIPPPRVFPS